MDNEPKDELGTIKSQLADLRMRLDVKEAEDLANVGGGVMMHLPETEFIPEWIPGGGGGGIGASSFLIYLADGTRFEVTDAQAMTGYDPISVLDGGAGHTDWSLEFGVTSSALDAPAGSGDPYVYTNPVGTSTLNEAGSAEYLHDADASADPVEFQSYYRLPIIRDGERVSSGGVFRENIMCAGSKGPAVELVRIG
jgi:hypothetical protein